MSTFSDLSEHTGTLAAIIGTLFLLCGGILAGIWKIGTKLILTFKDDVFKMIEKVDNRIESIWEEIGKIREKQEKLREELPEKFLRIDGPGYKALIDAVHDVKDAFNVFARDCRDGKCGGVNRRP